jgi:hypothetical protein
VPKEKPNTEAIRAYLEFSHTPDWLKDRLLKKENNRAGKKMKPLCKVQVGPIVAYKKFVETEYSSGFVGLPRILPPLVVVSFFFSFSDFRCCFGQGYNLANRKNNKSTSKHNNLKIPN